MTTGRALLGVLTGLAAGAVLGLLFSPQKKSRLNSEDLADVLGRRIDEKLGSSK